MQNCRKIDNTDCCDCSSSPSPPIIDTNIYNASGTLDAPRTVSLDGNNLSFVGTNTETFSVSPVTNIVLNGQVFMPNLVSGLGNRVLTYDTVTDRVIQSDPNLLPSTNIYNSDGTTTGPRQMNLDNGGLTITGNNSVLSYFVVEKCSLGVNISCSNVSTGNIQLINSGSGNITLQAVQSVNLLSTAGNVSITSSVNAISVNGATAVSVSANNGTAQFQGFSGTYIGNAGYNSGSVRIYAPINNDIRIFNLENISNDWFLMYNNGTNKVSKGQAFGFSAYITTDIPIVALSTYLITNWSTSNLGPYRGYFNDGVSFSTITGQVTFSVPGIYELNFTGCLELVNALAPVNFAAGINLESVAVPGRYLTPSLYQDIPAPKGTVTQTASKVIAISAAEIGSYRLLLQLSALPATFTIRGTIAGPPPFPGTGMSMRRLI